MAFTAFSGINGYPYSCDRPLLSASNSCSRKHELDCGKREMSLALGQTSAAAGARLWINTREKKSRWTGEGRTREDKDNAMDSTPQSNRVFSFIWPFLDL